MSVGDGIDPLLVALVGAVACLAALRWRARVRVALVLRLLAVGLLVLIAFDLGVRRDSAANDERAGVTLLVDRSDSMRVGEDGSRWAILSETWLTPEALDSLRDVARLRVIDQRGETFDPRDERSGTEGTAESPLVRTIASELAHETPAEHLVLLTDAIDSTGDSFATLEPAGTRVHAWSIPSERVFTDARVTLSTDPELVYAGRGTTLRAVVTHDGLASRRVGLVLEEDGRVLEERALTLPEHGASVVPFDVIPALASDELTGSRVYTVRLRTIAGEDVRTNNQASAIVRVTNEPIRVLVLEGQPHWDTRFVVRALRADGQIELTTVYTFEDRFGLSGDDVRWQIERTGVGDEDRALLVTDDPLDLDAYDVVVIGRAIEQFFPGREARRLVSYVGERGRAVIVLRGDPVVSQEPEARRTRDVLGAWLVAPTEVRLGPGEVRRSGHGTVLWVEGRGAHRGALVAPGAAPGERGAHARRWSSVVRSLALASELTPGADIAISVTPRRVQKGAPARVRVRVRDAGVPLPAALIWRTPSGQERRVDLAVNPGDSLRADALVRTEEEGVHQLRFDDREEARFVVHEGREEFQTLRERTSLAAALARSTGGLVLPMGDGPGALVERLQLERRARRAPDRHEPVWDRWWMSAGVGLLMLGAWVLERRASG